MEEFPMLTCDPCPECDYPYFVLDPRFPDRAIYACPGCGKRFTYSEYHAARAARPEKKPAKQSGWGILIAVLIGVGVFALLAL